MKNNIIIGVVILLLTGLVSAIPTPHGMDGIIYELDGITPISNLDFQVVNLNTNQIIQGKTRNNGYYSVSLDGNNGDIILFKAWNNYNDKNRTLQLNGVMHNVNLNFNNSIPNLPPIIYVNNSINTTVNSLFVYQIEAFDPNFDSLIYSITPSQEIIIDNFTGIFEWTPRTSGVFTFTLTVTDSEYIVNKPLTINVVDNNVSNSAPTINSTPINKAFLFHLYEYDVNAFDSDNDKLKYYLIKKPFNMYINRNTGKIKWYPLFRHIGNNKIKVMVSDGNSRTYQEFNINVKFPFRRPLIVENQEESPINNYVSSEEITVGSTTLFKRPKQTKIFEKTVYKYMEIESNYPPKLNTTFIFKVSRQWMVKNNANHSDIILNRFVKGKWTVIPMTFSHSDDYFHYYSAQIPGFSFFAISLKESKEENYIVSGPKESYVISGKIKNMNLFSSTTLKITNTNNKESKIIEPQKNGKFYTIISGNKGDLIKLESNKNSIKKDIILNKDLYNIILEPSNRFIDGPLIGVVVSTVLIILILWRRKNETS